MTPGVLAERLVLGSLMHGHAATAQAIADLPASAFADPAHRTIYWHLLVDHIQPDAEPDFAAELDDVGGLAYLDDLASSGSPDNAPESLIADACCLIRQRWLERRQLDADDAAQVRLCPDNVIRVAAWSTGGTA